MYGSGSGKESRKDPDPQLVCRLKEPIIIMDPWSGSKRRERELTGTGFSGIERIRVFGN